MISIPLTFTAWALALIGLLPGDDANSKLTGSPGTTWRFVLPAPGDPFEHAPFRALVLSHEKPEDLIEKATYRGDKARRRYAQIRFGSPGSIRVTVVLDEVGAGETDLYVDADRNRKIDDRDRVNGAVTGEGARHERIWRMPLSVSLIDKDITHTIPRAVIFRLGSSGRTLGYAAAGFLEGRVKIKDLGIDDKHPRTQAARRVDGDGNGFVTDAQDRLWIDSNSDESFDPSTEQVLFATVLNLDGSRYVVRSDELGSWLAFEPMVGVGTLRLALINVAYRGEPISPAAQETLGARINLATTNDQNLATARSGFA